MAYTPPDNGCMVPLAASVAKMSAQVGAINPLTVADIEAINGTLAQLNATLQQLNQQYHGPDTTSPADEITERILFLSQVVQMYYTRVIKVPTIAAIPPLP